jgi:hypothetical protein
MENQTIEQEPVNKKKLFLSVFTIIAIIAVLAFVGYMIFGKKIVTKHANNGTATLSWNANDEPDLAGYRIYYGTAPRSGDCPPGGYYDKIDVGKTSTPEKPSYKIENLADGKTYYFSVTSFDTSGNESCFSAEMSKAIK